MKFISLSFALHQIFFLLSCQNSRSHAWRLQPSVTRARPPDQVSAGDPLKPSSALTKLFHSLHPAAGFQASAPGVHFAADRTAFAGVRPPQSRQDIWRRNPQMSMNDDSAKSSQVSTMAADANLFARKHLDMLLNSASNWVLYDEICESPVLFVLIQCSVSYVTAMLTAGLLADKLHLWSLANLNPMLSNEFTSRAVLYGLLGGAVVRNVENWRRAFGDKGEPYEHGVRLGMWTTQFTLNWMGYGNDRALGERAVSSVNDQPLELPKCILHMLGTLASCCWVHIVLQQDLAQQFAAVMNEYVLKSMPDMPQWLAWKVAALDVAALDHAVVTASAIYFTAVFACAADDAASRLLRPKANYEAEASREAVATARKRCAKLFVLNAPPEVAKLRSEAFDEVAKEWEAKQQERDERAQITSAVRALVAAIVYTASGGSLIAPFLASIAGSDSLDPVFALIHGKPNQRQDA
mmetsp:Transcript_149470/g.264316  ORF Transcript_149470/g.264316 Transcript_149470/m.264316 type:complete len:466 (-) Transcript_149470:231-1628(-)